MAQPLDFPPVQAEERWLNHLYTVQPCTRFNSEACLNHVDVVQLILFSCNLRTREVAKLCLRGSATSNYSSNLVPGFLKKQFSSSVIKTMTFLISLKLFFVNNCTIFLNFLPTPFPTMVACSFLEEPLDGSVWEGKVDYLENTICDALFCV